MDNQPDIQTIDAYISQYPPEIQKLLQELRAVIRESAPDAVEKISWRMPTFYLYGNLVHFAAFKNHIGFYPGAEGIASFQDQFSIYQFSKGAVQFPINKPLPFDLVREIVRFRVAENTREAGIKLDHKKTKKQ